VLDTRRVKYGHRYWTLQCFFRNTCVCFVTSPIIRFSSIYDNTRPSSPHTPFLACEFSRSHNEVLRPCFRPVYTAIAKVILSVDTAHNDVDLSPSPLRVFPHEDMRRRVKCPTWSLFFPCSSQPQKPTFDSLKSESDNRGEREVANETGLGRLNGPADKTQEPSARFKIVHHDDDSSSSDDDEDSTSSSEVAVSRSLGRSGDRMENDIDHRRPPPGLARGGSSEAVNLRNRDAQDSRGGAKLSQSASSGSVTSIASRRTTRPASLHLSSSVVTKDIRPSVMSAHEIGSRPTAAAQPIVASVSIRSVFRLIFSKP